MLLNAKTEGKRSKLQSTLGLAIGLMLSAAGLHTTVDGAWREPSRAEATAARIAEEIAAARGEARASEVYIRLRLDGNRLIRERSADGRTFAPDRVLLDLPEGVTATFEEGRQTRG